MSLMYGSRRDPRRFAAMFCPSSSRGVILSSHRSTMDFHGLTPRIAAMSEPPKNLVLSIGAFIGAFMPSSPFCVDDPNDDGSLRKVECNHWGPDNYRIR